MFESAVPPRTALKRDPMSPLTGLINPAYRVLPHGWRHGLNADARYAGFRARLMVGQSRGGGWNSLRCEIFFFESLQVKYEDVAPIDFQHSFSLQAGEIPGNQLPDRTNLGS